MPKQEPYPVAHWNPGDRKAFGPKRRLPELRQIILDLFRTTTYTPRPIIALHLNETADLIPMLEGLRADFLDLVTGTPRVPHSRKIAIVYNPARLRPTVDGYNLRRTYRGFKGRRGGGKTMMLAPRFYLAQEFRDLATGWSPTHSTGHVVPTVSLNAKQAAGDVRAKAVLLGDTRGTVLHSEDWNMKPGHRIMAPVRDLPGYTYGPDRFGDMPTIGQGRFTRAIDYWLARESGHYRMTEQQVVDMPGRERSGVEHGLVYLDGLMRVRAGWQATA